MNTGQRQNLPYIPELLANKIDYWIKRKNNNYDTSFVTNRRNIYILPSKSGWLFIASLIAILSGAINYNNSLAYLLCFFLASLGFVAMLQTHQNLNNLIIKAAHTSSVYCGQKIEFKFLVSSKTEQHHFAIQTPDNKKDFSVTKDQDTQFFVLDTAATRGKQNPKRFKLFTEFPLGLFHAWTQVQINNPVIVYPKPIKHDLSEAAFFSGNQHQNISTGDDEFSGIRDFKKGDSSRSLAWKIIAKTNQLYTKEFHSESGDYLFFDYDKLNQSTNIEEKISILCGLILNADSKNINYGLKLPDNTIKPGNGQQHKHKCLTMLALYKSDSYHQ